MPTYPETGLQGMSPADLTWLTGSWHAQVGSDDIEEHWSALRGGCLVHRRNESGSRTHHIHMVEARFEHWDRLLFRDYLVRHPDVAPQYGELKTQLSRRHDRDRIAYTTAMTDCILDVTARAKEYFGSGASSDWIPTERRPRSR